MDFLDFIATCSPTAIYDNQSSSIVTCAAGKHPFPTTIRVTLSSGFVFCLRRDQCEVWSVSPQHCLGNLPFHDLTSGDI